MAFYMEKRFSVVAVFIGEEEISDEEGVVEKEFFGQGGFSGESWFSGEAEFSYGEAPGKKDFWNRKLIFDFVFLRILVEITILLPILINTLNKIRFFFIDTLVYFMYTKKYYSYLE